MSWIRKFGSPQPPTPPKERRFSKKNSRGFRGGSGGSGSRGRGRGWDIRGGHSGSPWQASPRKYHNTAAKQKNLHASKVASEESEQDSVD